MSTYRIVRFYQDDYERNGEEVTDGLTLEEAQAWCQDPETSSRTCTNEVGRARTEKYGSWFEGYQID